MEGGVPGHGYTTSTALKIEAVARGRHRAPADGSEAAPGAKLPGPWVLLVRTAWAQGTVGSATARGTRPSCAPWGGW
jgi:hypothetical protein